MQCNQLNSEKLYSNSRNSISSRNEWMRLYFLFLERFMRICRYPVSFIHYHTKIIEQEDSLLVAMERYIYDLVTHLGLRSWLARKWPTYEKKWHWNYWSNRKTRKWITNKRGVAEATSIYERFNSAFIVTQRTSWCNYTRPLTMTHASEFKRVGYLVSRSSVLNTDCFGNMKSGFKRVEGQTDNKFSKWTMI